MWHDIDPILYKGLWFVVCDLWLNRFYKFYVAAVVESLVGMALQLKYIVEPNLIRATQYCISHYFSFTII